MTDTPLHFTNAAAQGPTGTIFSASGGQPPRTEQQTSADLHQAIWEASQFKGPAALREFCEQTIRSIEGDQP